MFTFVGHTRERELGQKRRDLGETERLMEVNIKVELLCQSTWEARASLSWRERVMGQGNKG